jgi:ferredoxin--NADP+ reductase
MPTPSGFAVATETPLAIARASETARTAPTLGAARTTPRHHAVGVCCSMTHHHSDTRSIDDRHEHYNARLVRRVDQTEDLATFWVAHEGEAPLFEPGQYMTIGVYADGKLVQRPYSVASAPSRISQEGYEFYVRLVPVLRFTTLLWRLPVGHRMRMIGPKGRFLLEPDDNRTHLFIATGTGIAPFVSMIRETLLHGKPRRTIMLHGCSYVDELGYRELLEQWQHDGTYPVSYVPTISRPSDPRNADWSGYTGRAEAVVHDVCRAFRLRPERTVVYICGNPDMILNAESVLMDDGYPEFHVKKELYWPKGKVVAPASVGG